MNDKKNIERLFQEKFKDFEVNPSPVVWESIASKLEKKKEKKRIFPFWFNAKAAGIAAALVLGFYTLNNNSGWKDWNVFNATSVDNQSDQTVVEKNTPTVKGKEKIPTGSLNRLSNEDDNSVASSEENQLNKQYKGSQNALATSIQSNSQSHENTPKSNTVKANTAHTKVPPSLKNQQTIPATLVQTDNKAPFSSGQTANPVVVANQETGKNTIVNNSLKSNVADKTVVLNKNETIPTNQSQVITNSSDQNSNTSTIVNQVAEKDMPNSKRIISDRKENDITVISNDKKNNTVNENNAIADVFNRSTSTDANQKDKNKFVQEAMDSKIPEEGKTIESNTVIKESKNTAIANQLVIEQKDSMVIAQTEENPLEKILKDKESVKKEEKEKFLSSKWGVRPTIAAVFSGASNGSPISSEFADNQKTFDTKFGLGIGVDYEASKKITLRSGVNKVDLAYNTDGISFYTDLSGKMDNTNTMRNINRNSTSANMIIEDRSSVNTVEIAAFEKDSGVLKQQIGYIEIPMEVSYKILDKKFGLNFITGISTLFLSDNTISIIRDGMTTEIGEANNLNKVHFSTNIGVGMKYNILKSLEASFEPTFKYQVNTFSSDSGNFKPYVIGLYTGLRYKF